MRIIIDPPILAVMGFSTEMKVFPCSTAQVGDCCTYNRYHLLSLTEICAPSKVTSCINFPWHGDVLANHTVQYITDFTKDFRISTEIFGFRAKDFRFHERFQAKCTRFR